MDALVDDMQEGVPGDVAAQLELARQCDAQGRSDVALQWLRRAAATGDAGAMAALGRHLLTRQPLDIEAGASATAAAAAAGSADAAHLMAILAGGGLAVPQSWRVALDYLQRAAELGHTFARTELAVLAGEPGVEAAIAAGENIAPALWERLRKAIDVRTWLTVPRALSVSPDLRIAIAENFIPPRICAWLIERSRPNLTRAQIDDPATGTARYGGMRTNSAAEFALPDSGLILHLLRARISALAGPPPSAMEGSTVLHYEAGQQFFPHYDFLDTANPGYAKQVAEYGQRVLTFLIYLNDGFEGGETDFPTIPWRFKGKTGDALFFWNVLPSGQPDRRTYHAGLPPESGEKWLFSQWVRGRLS